MANAEGIDVSSFQAPLTIAQLAGLDFAHCKATEGLSITDPDLGVNWTVLGQWGKPRGLYHEFVPADNPSAQAQYCHQAVVNAGGFRPGDFVSVVASDYTGTTGAEIAAWCAEMSALAGPQVTVQVYSDLSVLPSLAACTGWPLWVSWPNGTPPTSAQVAPWKTFTFWQSGISGTDRDQFNGTAAALAAYTAVSGAPSLPPEALEMVTAQYSDGRYIVISTGTDNLVRVTEQSSLGSGFSGNTASIGGPLPFSGPLQVSVEMGTVGASKDVPSVFVQSADPPASGNGDVFTSWPQTAANGVVTWATWVQVT